MTTTRIALATVSLTAVAALGLSACSSGATSGQGSGGSTPTPSTSSAPTSSSPTPTVTTSSAAPATSASSSAAAPASGTVVKVNIPFSDAAIGESGTVLGYVRNFQASAATKAKYSLIADSEVVLVQVKVNSSKKYYDSLGSDSFFLLGTSDQQNSEDNEILGADMGKAGYMPLADAENGKSSTGWIAFPIDKGATKLTLQFYVLAASTSNGKTIPARTFNLPLVK